MERPVVIEKNIKRPHKWGYWKEMAYQMEVGDSIKFDTPEDACSLRHAVRAYRNSEGLTTRRRYENKRGDKGWRVWLAEQ